MPVVHYNNGDGVSSRRISRSGRNVVFREKPGKRSKQRKYIIDEDTRRSKPSFEKENIYLVQQPTYYVTSRHPHHRRKKNKKKPYKSRQFYDEEVYPSFVTNSSRHNKVRQRYHDLGKRDDFDEVMIIDDSRVLANSHQRNKDVFVIVDDGLSSNRRSYSENYAANDKEIHFFNDHHLDRVEDIGYGRRETFGDPIHSNVGYNNQSYIVDERRWNLPKVPRSSISKEEYSTWHCQARSADYQAYMDSRENDESKFIGVINQPPLQKKYCRSSSSQKTSHSHLQDDEEFLQEGDSRVLSVLSQHPQRQNRDYVKWQTISDAPKIVEDAVHTNSQHSNQSMMMENKIVKSTLQEFDRETDLKSNVSPPSPSLYAVVRKTDNNFKNDKIHHNKRESRMHQNRSTTNDGSNETTTTTTTKSMKMRTVGDIGHPEDRKISQTSSTTTTAQKVSHVKQPVAEKIQSSHQESYTGHQSWEKRILQKKSSKVEEELKAWMDLQRKESDLNRYNINQSILTQSVLMNGEEQPNPTRRSRVDTLTIVPQNDTLVGSYNTENYVDATDNVSPKNGAIQPNNIRNEPYFAEDFVNKPDTSKREKRKSPGFFGRLKNKLSSNPKSNEQQEEDEDDSGEEEEYWEKPKKCLDDIKEKVEEITQCVKDYMDHETSPWGRLKKCGNRETCKELQNRILGRTIFMTPTGANEEHSKMTELNLDKMEQGEDDHPFFISRSVENDPNAKSDDEEDEDECRDTKCGKYIKLYCPQEKRWKDEL